MRLLPKPAVSGQVLLACGLIVMPLPAVTPTMAWAKQAQQSESSDVTAGTSVNFVAGEHGTLNEAQQSAIQNILESTHSAVQDRLPDLADQVNVTVELVDWDLSTVGGVTGRADAPGQIAIQISAIFEGGVNTAITQGLETTFAHELHHLVRGWTISGNQFGPGISIAAANEGLAIVFAEEFTGHAKSGDAPPADDVAEAWAAEILALPRNANYQEWMFQHPDGRTAIGYRTGNFIVRRAMENSGLDIVQMSSLAPEEIWALAGF